MDLIIENGTIVTADGTFAANVGIVGEKIAQIGGNLGTAVKTIDASGCYVMPGGIDVHTHLDLPVWGTKTADDFKTGTIAAACGGTTSIIDFCAQVHGQSLKDAIATWDTKAKGKASVDYGYHMIIVDLNELVFRELAGVPEMGITSFKLFMAYRGMMMVDDVALIRALETARRTGALVMVHAENGDAAAYLQQKYLSEGKSEPKYHAASRPPRVEAEATARAIALAEIVGASLYVVHMTCEESLEELIRGKRRGVDVYAETCSQYLYLVKEDLDRPNFEGAKFVFTPPARTVRDHEALWNALGDGFLETVSSDHSGTNFKGDKELGRDDFTKIPNGIPGIEERMMLVYQGVNQGRLTINQFVYLMSTRPAQLFGLFPRKGSLSVGADADLIIWDPAAKYTISQKTLHQKADYSCYEGREIQGVPRTVLLRGKVIVDGRQFVGEVGEGRFLRRDKFVS